jgi:uncharacterized iron-regulated protein
MMRAQNTVLAVVLQLLMAVTIAGQEKPLDNSQFRVYSANGKVSTLDDITAAMADTEVVFIGELHNDPAAHLFELQLLQKASARYGLAATAGRVLNAKSSCRLRCSSVMCNSCSTSTSPI